MKVLAEMTDQFDVVLDLASSTLADGSSVESMRLARGIQAFEAYTNKLLAVVEAARECDEYLSAEAHWPLNQIGARSPLHHKLGLALSALNREEGMRVEKGNGK